MASAIAGARPRVAAREIAELRCLSLSPDVREGVRGQIALVTPGDVVSVLLRDDSADRFTGDARAILAGQDDQARL